MKKIAIISDTHGVIKSEVKDLMNRVDMIIHAGDVDNYSTYIELLEWENIHIVRGNNDFFEDIPPFLQLKIEDINVFVVHDVTHVPSDIKNTDLVIFGHSHKYTDKKMGNILFLNPGSCGKKRFDYGLSMIEMTINGSEIGYKKIEIE